jgi:hypothetical protein
LRDVGTRLVAYHLSCQALTDEHDGDPTYSEPSNDRFDISVVIADTFLGTSVIDAAACENHDAYPIRDSVIEPMQHPVGCITGNSLVGHVRIDPALAQQCLELGRPRLGFRQTVAHRAGVA